MRNQNCNSIKKNNTLIGALIKKLDSTILSGAIILGSAMVTMASGPVAASEVPQDYPIANQIVTTKTNKDTISPASGFYYNSDNYFNFYIPRYNIQHIVSDSTGELVKITVFDSTEKRTLPIYKNNGNLYVVGFPGHEYSVNIRNQAREEILAVTTVDGINAINGNVGDFLDTGYIVGPYQKLPVNGWRKSLDHSAKFYFTQLDDGYSYKTDKTNDVGVLGIAIFRKKEFMPYYPHEANKDTIQIRTPSTIPSRGNESEYVPNHPQTKKLNDSDSFNNSIKPVSTGHGEVIYSPAKRSFFQRRINNPEEVVRIYYNSFENLVNMGILVRPKF